MSDGRRPHGTGISDEDIEDAEFIEISDDGSASDAPSGQSRVKRRWGFWKIFAAAFCAMLMWVAFVAVLRSLGAWPLFHITHSEPSPDLDAQQMLSEWSLQVTGTARENGFFMIDGSGDPGASCDSDDGTQMLKFGGMQLGQEQGTEIYDYFSMVMTKTKTMIAGAYWFDPAASTLTIRNAKIFDLAGNPKASMRDSTVNVAPSGDGTIMFRGARFHVCVMTEANR